MLHLSYAKRSWSFKRWFHLLLFFCCKCILTTQTSQPPETATIQRWWRAPAVETSPTPTATSTSLFFQIHFQWRAAVFRDPFWFHTTTIKSRNYYLRPIFWKDQRSKVSDKLSPQFQWGDAASSGWDQTLGVTPQGAAEGSGRGIRDEWEYWLEPPMRLQRSDWPVERRFSEDSKQQESKMCWLAARSDWS